MATAADAPQSAEQPSQRPETRNTPSEPSGGSPETHHGPSTGPAHVKLFHHLLYGWAASEPVANQLLAAHRAETLAGNADATAERDCLALAVLFAQQWKPDAPMGLREGIEEILTTMPAADAPADFFRPGHTYSSSIFGGPFTVDYVGTHPGTGERFAHGWVHYSDGSWAPQVVTGLFDRFTDVTAAGEVSS